MVADLARNWGARLVQPLARILARWGFSPNSVTILGFLLTLGVAAILATGRVQLAGALLILTLGLDAVDGTLARLVGRTSRFGAFLDSTLDRWSELALYAALTWLFVETGQDRSVLLVFAAAAMSFMVSYTRARAEGIGIQCKEGIFTRFERAVVLIAGLLLDRVTWALGIIAVLASLTALQRIWVTWLADRTSKRP